MAIQMIVFGFILQPMSRQPQFQVVTTNISGTALLYDTKVKNPAG